MNTDGFENVTGVDKVKAGEFGSHEYIELWVNHEAESFIREFLTGAGWELQWDESSPEFTRMHWTR